MQAKRSKVMLVSFVTLRTMALEEYWCVVDVGASSPSSNVEPAHNTTKYFAPTYDEVLNLTGLL
jgi:hypothetical protein